MLENIFRWLGIHSEILMVLKTTNFEESDGDQFFLLPFADIHLPARGVRGGRILSKSPIGQRKSSIDMRIV